MKGSECKMVAYMSGSQKRFIIPVYQRNYDWKAENCKQLYDDLIHLVHSNRSSHFFGSVVSAHNPDGHNMELLIIDGQQRLTTVSLLFLAMYNLMSQGKIKSQNPVLCQMILEEYLIDKWQPEETRIKLKPVKNDQKAFRKLFQNDDEHIKESNLTINYGYFYERIQMQEITVDELYDAICKLEIIEIGLNGDDNPQLIFESLNSTGLDLSEGDKIRNYVLMGLSSQEQELYYDKYWNRIEENTRYDVSAFIRDYISLKTHTIPPQKRIYIHFKEYLQDENPDMETLLQDMLAYAKRYHILLSGKTSSSPLNACIYRLNRLETTVTRPFFLEVLRLLEEKVLTIEEVLEIFRTTENYLFRRTICDLPTNTLNKIFLALHHEIIRFEGTSDRYVSKFKFALLSKTERARFPADEEFCKDFSERKVYQMNSKNKIYILERLENGDSKEDKDIYRHCDSGEYSIEHIMPQHLTPAWMQELGDNYASIHEIWLHRIANLTLTAYNPDYSNHSFLEKKNHPNGFKFSGIRLNVPIAEHDKWTLAELEERNQFLVKEALKIWPFPSTDYQSPQKQYDSCALEEDTPLTGREIVKFSFKNAEQPASTWTEMFDKVIHMLYDEDASILMKIALSEDSGDNFTCYFTNDVTKFHRGTKLGGGLYVLTNTSTSTKISILRKLFKLYDIDPTNLVFYLKDVNEAQNEISIDH